ncbi:MAG: DUF2285 domain-containing protein [Alphaproteobacteria bacterium]|nr:DUF2285 domain-containing protein [Alphaproteobacteria bacterium]
MAGGSTFAALPDRQGEPTLALWSADADPAVVSVEATPARAQDADSFDLTHFPMPALVAQGAIEHVLLGDVTCQLRLDVRRGTVLRGPVRLRYELSGVRSLDAKLLTMRRLAAATRLGRFPRQLMPPNCRARRWMMALRAWDARMAGAEQREIAGAVFGRGCVESDWNGASDYLRCRVQRLIRLGDVLVHGGYRRLLK